VCVPSIVMHRFVNTDGRYYCVPVFNLSISMTAGAVSANVCRCLPVCRRCFRSCVTDSAVYAQLVPNVSWVLSIIDYSYAWTVFTDRLSGLFTYSYTPLLSLHYRLICDKCAIVRVCLYHYSTRQSYCTPAKPIRASMDSVSYISLPRLITSDRWRSAAGDH